jgi:predicted dehydrogenase
MRLAFVGCGFVADYYASTLPNYPDLELVGVADRNAERAAQFASYWKVPVVYPTLDALLGDKSVELVVNLTNPRSHYEVSRACLSAGRHVYSEKPLATIFPQAEELVHLAERKGLLLSSAPCNVLGECAQTAWKALREGEIGRVRLAYAEIDEGLVHRMRYQRWTSPSGAPWPYKDEFEVGCTLEHAAYYLTWLVSFFGPARVVTSFAGCQIPDKGTDVPLEVVSPDFAVACIEFVSGVSARLTCSIVAPHDHHLRIFGDDGILTVEECWHYGAPVYIKRQTNLTIWAEKFRLLSALPGFAARKYPAVRPANFKRYKGNHAMDFSRGIGEMAAALREHRPSRLAARFCLHVNEIVLAMQYPKEMGSPRLLTTTFEPPEPMTWALAPRNSNQPEYLPRGGSVAPTST